MVAVCMYYGGASTHVPVNKFVLDIAINIDGQAYCLIRAHKCCPRDQSFQQQYGNSGSMQVNHIKFAFPECNL